MSVEIRYYESNFLTVIWLIFAYLYFDEPELSGALRLLHPRSLPQHQQDINLGTEEGQEAGGRGKASQEAEHSDVDSHMADPDLHPIMCNVSLFLSSLELDRSLIVKVFGYLRLS